LGLGCGSEAPGDHEVAPRFSEPAQSFLELMVGARKPGDAGATQFRKIE
jgi:hypothetical protein